MAETDEPYNPYAGPRARDTDVDRAPGRDTRGSAVTWAYAVVALTATASYLALFFHGAIGLSADVTQMLVMLVDRPLSWIRWIVALVWIHTAWSGLPASLLGDMTPGRAVGRLFIPIYSVYWIFAVNVELCRRINDRLAEQHDPRRAPVVLAMLATALHFAPLLLLFSEFKAFAWVPIVASMGMWIAFMWQTDAARRAITAP